ncbi:MAG: hypothetical protein ACFFG0_25580 [Candidatus Thorarchaeota archaeon]
MRDIEKMPCIHGLDEINCPICRTSKFTFPSNALNRKKAPYIKIGNLLFNKHDQLNYKIAQEITAKKINIISPPASPISKPFLINEVPNFENKILLDRFQELDISKEDNFGISKKIPLENPEWQFEEED